MGGFYGATVHGAGHHAVDIGTGAEYEGMMRWVYVMMIMMITGMSIVKISVGFFLLRFLGHTWLRKVIIGIQGMELAIVRCRNAGDGRCPVLIRLITTLTLLCHGSSFHHSVDHRLRGTGHLPMHSNIRHLCLY